jgi:type IV pilus assembly protein PilZ
MDVSDDATKSGSAKPPASRSSAPSEPGLERRRTDRYDVTWSVDCETEDTFLYACITNISEMGIFVRTDRPLPVGTRLVLRFAPPTAEAPFVVDGVVQWINPVKPLGENLNPGMGIRFDALTPDDRERLVEAVRTIAYVREPQNN